MITSKISEASRYAYLKIIHVPTDRELVNFVWGGEGRGDELPFQKTPDEVSVFSFLITNF